MTTNEQSAEGKPKRGRVRFFVFVVAIFIVLAALLVMYRPAGGTGGAGGGAGGGKVVNLDTGGFRSAASSGLLVVDFWAEWCGPCRIQGPIIDKLANKQPDGVVIAKVDVDAEGALAEELEIHGIPTVIIFKNGKEMRRFVGVTGEAELSKAIREAM